MASILLLVCLVMVSNSSTVQGGGKRRSTGMQQFVIDITERMTSVVNLGDAASRDDGFPPKDCRGHVIPALTDHLADKGGMVGAKNINKRMARAG